MQLAIDARLEDLAKVTGSVIERLIRNRHRYPSGYTGCHSTNVTGYAGVQVYLVHATGLTEVHIKGPDGLVTWLQYFYGPQCPVTVHTPTHLSLRLP